MYADLINDNKLLAPGMFVDVSHSLGMDEKVLFVPERSLMPILDGQQVYKIVDGKAYAVTAIIGKRLNGNVQIINGLTHDDVVVTDGQMKLKSGMTVKIKT
jgi:membrane fusion protein (multidrug efflux system)